LQEAEPAPKAAVVLVILAILTVGAAWGATLIEPEVDFVDTVPDHSGLQPYRALLQELDGVRFLAIYQAHDDQSGTTSLRGDAFDALVDEQVGFSEDLRAAFPDAFGHELSVQEAMKQGNYMFQKIATGGNPPDSAYSMPEDQATYNQVKQQLLADDTLDDVLAPDGSSALSLFFIPTTEDGDARALVIDAADWLESWSRIHGNHPVTSEHQPTGLVWASAYTDSLNQRDMKLWVPIAAAAVALVLLWIVRGPANVLIATLSLGAALTWTFGLMGALGIRISFLTVFLAPVVVGIGIDYAVHILHRYEEERGSGANRSEALNTAIRRTGSAVGLAAGTTIIALLWMATVPADLFAQIGLVGAIGVLFGFIASVTLTPALRAVIPDSRSRTRKDRIGPIVGQAARIPPAVAWLAVLLVSATVAWGAAGNTEVESGSQANEFPQNDPVIVLQGRIEQEYGAFQRAYIVVQGDIARADALLAIHYAVENASALPLFRDASAVTDILLADEATNEGSQDVAQTVLENQTSRDRSDAERLPQTDAEARQALAALFDDPLWRAITPFTIGDDLHLAVVAIELEPWQGQEELFELRDELRVQAAKLQSEMGSSYDVNAAGAPINRAEIIDQTLPDIIRIVVGTSGLVFGILAMAWLHKPRGLLTAFGGGLLVLISGAALVTAVSALDAIYQSSGSPNSAALTEMFLLAFAITVGIGVDDLVQVAQRTWEFGSLRTGMERAGRAITGTTATTFVAFAVMGGVYFLQSKNLAILTATGVLIAYLLTLLMTPAVLGGLSKNNS
jgi:predicted RND superfamily exporter protein